jgi:hypothetical protein
MVENLVEAEALGDLDLKGFHRPVAAWNIVGLQMGDPSLDRGAE